MSEGTRKRLTCPKCGGYTDDEDTVAPSLWCNCPTEPVKGIDFREGPDADEGNWGPVDDWE